MSKGRPTFLTTAIFLTLGAVPQLRAPGQTPSEQLKILMIEFNISRGRIKECGNQQATLSAAKNASKSNNSFKTAFEARCQNLEKNFEPELLERMKEAANLNELANLLYQTFPYNQALEGNCIRAGAWLQAKNMAAIISGLPGTSKSGRFSAVALANLEAMIKDSYSENDAIREQINKVMADITADDATILSISMPATLSPTSLDVSGGRTSPASSQREGSFGPDSDSEGDVTYPNVIQPCPVDPVYPIDDIGIGGQRSAANRLLPRPAPRAGSRRRAPMTARQPKQDSATMAWS